MLPCRAVELFADQYGLISLAQARAELTSAERRCLYRHSDIDRIGLRVLRHRAAPESLGAQLLAPVLDAGTGAVLWDVSGELWFGFGRDRSPIVHVARIRKAIPEPLGRIHHVTRLDPRDITVYRGIPIARPELLILAAAAREVRRSHPTRVSPRLRAEGVDPYFVARMKTARVLDHAWRMKLIDGERAHEISERHSRKGQAGSGVLRELLKVRPPGYIPTDSNLETRFEEVAGPWATAQLRRQVPVYDDDGFVGRPDFLGRTRPIAVEVHSEVFHTTLTDRENDERRYQRLLGVGLSVLVVWEYDLWHRASLIHDVITKLLNRPDSSPTLHRPTPAPWELLRAPD